MNKRRKKRKTKKQKSKYSLKNIYSLLKTPLFVAILTALLTTLGSHYIMKSQVSLIAADNKINKKYELLEEFTKLSVDFELTREQAYWNKFFWHLNILFNESLKEMKFDNLEKDINQNIQRESEIQFKYNMEISQIQALLLLIPQFYEDIDKNNVINCEKKLNQGIGFNYEYLEEKYWELYKTNGDYETFYNELNRLMEEQYNTDFYNEALLLIKEMQCELLHNN